MKNKSLFVITLISTLTALSSYAGDKTGNGGISVVCRDENKNIISAELLDIAEMKNYFKMNPGKSMDSSLNGYLDYAAMHLEQITNIQGTHIQLKDSFDKMLKSTVTIGGGFLLPDPKDFNPRILPKKCAFEVAALYSDSENILRVDEEIYSKFDEYNKAALIVHEVLYRAKRGRNKDPIITSDDIRLLVAKTMSDSGYEYSADYLKIFFDNMVILRCFTRSDFADFKFGSENFNGGSIYLKINTETSTDKYSITVSSHYAMNYFVTFTLLNNDGKILSVMNPTPIKYWSFLDGGSLDNTSIYTSMSYSTTADGKNFIHFGCGYFLVH